MFDSEIRPVASVDRGGGGRPCAMGPSAPDSEWHVTLVPPASIGRSLSHHLTSVQLFSLSLSALASGRLGAQGACVLGASPLLFWSSDAL